MSNKKTGTLTKSNSGRSSAGEGLADDALSAGIEAVRSGLSEKEFDEKFSEEMKQPVNRNKTVGRLNRPTKRTDTLGSTKGGGGPAGAVAGPDALDDCKLTRIVIKVTTISNASAAEAPFYMLDASSARIGLLPENEVSIATDVKMAPVAHATVEYQDGAFFLVDGGFENSASVKLIPNRLIWVLENGARFSAGSSVFQSCGLNAEGALLLETVAGPLRGERRFVTRKGVTIGRHTDNSIPLPADKELSRKHSKIVFDDATGKYYVCDVGSTNGTYMQLVGPYGMKYRLNLNDNILVGRTGFEVNRFESVISEEKGGRPAMEDSSVDYQQIKIAGLTHPSVSPLSFFGVYDGHGGSQASAFLAENLHKNVAERLAKVASDVQTAGANGAEAALDNLVVAAIKDAFLKTDVLFLQSANVEPGSTATTVMILGQRIYCANDHKPSREDEGKRIKDAGGHIINNRVMGVLAVSRSFGDANLKKSVREMMGDTESVPNGAKNIDEPLVISVPEIKMHNISKADEFLLLACDGLFDVFSNEEVCSFVKDFMTANKDSQKCVQALSDEAIKKRGAKDNVSIILIILNRWY